MSSRTLISNSIDAEALAEAYLTLINGIPGFKDEVSDFFELSDGHVFSRLLVELDKIHFKKLEKVKEENWLLKVSNLRKLYISIESFIKENQSRLGKFKVAPIDYHHVAKSRDIRELVTNNLPKTYQNLLAKATNEITQETQPSNNTSSQVHTKEIPNIQLKRQLDALKSDYEMEIEGLKKDYDRVYEELQFARTNLEEIQNDRKILQKKIDDYQSNLVRAGDFSKTELYLKQEIDDLRNSLTEAEQKRHEAEMIISRQNADLSEQNRQIQSLNEKAQKLDKLEDIKRELNLKSDQLQRSDNTIEKLKSRIEDLNDFKKRFKASEEQNFKLVERNSELEEEIQKLKSFKLMNDEYKEQILNLTARTNTLNLENERNQFEIRNLKENIRILEMERDRYQEESMNFQSKLRDFELGLQTNLSDDIAESGGISLGEAETENLKAKIVKLEQELTSLRNGTKESGSAQRIIILENMLEDSKKARNKVEEELMVSHRNNLLLEEELKRFQSSQAGDKMSYDLSLNLRLRLSESEEEVSKLKRKLAETEISLEQVRNELLIAKTDLSMVGKDQLESVELAKQEIAKQTEKLSQEYNETKEKCATLEEEARKQMQLVNQLLLDKDSLKTQSLQQKDMLLENEKTIGQLKATLATLENQGPGGASADELSQVKEMLVKETNRNMELREENVRLKGLEENLNLKISLLTEQIKSFEKSAQESSNNGQVIFSEALASLKADLKSKEDELDRVKHQFMEAQKQHRLEAAFMTSAWHDLGLRVIRDKASVTNGPGNRQPASSWLAIQRNNLNVQLKRR